PYPLPRFCSPCSGLASKSCRERMSYFCLRWPVASPGGHTLAASCSERCRHFQCGVAYGVNLSELTNGTWRISAIREADFLDRGREIRERLPQISPSLALAFDLNGPSWLSQHF